MDESYVWYLDAVARGRIKIGFDKSVTFEEARELFNEGMYEDILDEDWDSIEIV